MTLANACNTYSAETHRTNLYLYFEEQVHENSPLSSSFCRIRKVKSRVSFWGARQPFCRTSRTAFQT